MTHALPLDRLDALRAAQQNAYDRAPAIRDIYERARMTPQDIRSAADLARLPVTSKDALLDRQREAPPFGGFLAADEAALETIADDDRRGIHDGDQGDQENGGDEHHRLAGL